MTPRTHPYKETYKGPAGVPLADPRKPSQDARSLYDEVEPYDLYPEDDDYDPDEMERRENMPSREEFAQLFR